MGTGGNDIPKCFLKKTTEGKTKGLVDKAESFTGWVRLEKHGQTISAYKKNGDYDHWVKVEDYESDWLKGEIQTGFSVTARFAGDGPKQHPDMKAVFSSIKMETR
jgi:hypothetical protein